MSLGGAGRGDGLTCGACRWFKPAPDGHVVVAGDWCDWLPPMRMRGLLWGVHNPAIAREQPACAAFAPLTRPHVDRAGPALRWIIERAPRDRSWTVAEAAAGSEIARKEIYNAVGYLTRTGALKRIGRGRYVWLKVEAFMRDGLPEARS